EDRDRRASYYSITSRARSQGPGPEGYSTHERPPLPEHRRCRFVRVEQPRLLALESQAGRPLQEQDPFLALLVVPEPLGRGAAQRDDPLDADARRPCRYPDAEPGGGP